MNLVYMLFIKKEGFVILEKLQIYALECQIQEEHIIIHRKKVGKLIFNSELVKNKYPDDIETKMNQYFEDHITVSFVAIDFGRLEIETALIDSYPESQLLNSIGKRGRK